MSTCPLNGKQCEEEKSVNITTIVNGESTGFNLCPRCAKLFFNDEDLNKLDSISTQSPSNLLKSMIEIFQNVSKSITPKSSNKLIPSQFPKLKPIVQEITLEKYAFDLRSKLKDAIDREDYKKAEEYKPLINALEKIEQQNTQLQNKLNEAVNKGNFDDAVKINLILSDVIKNFLKEV